MKILLVSTYELGNQPINLGYLASFLLDEELVVKDLSIEDLSDEDIMYSDAIVMSVPMHTAFMLSSILLTRVRAISRSIPVAFFGLSAHLGRDLLSENQVNALFSGECEEEVSRWIRSIKTQKQDAQSLNKINFIGWQRIKLTQPNRKILPPLENYSKLQICNTTYLVGSLETTRGCSHKCTHCPVPVVYNGRVRKIETEIVLADLDQLIQDGAEHISFLDPDFLNMPAHAIEVAKQLHLKYPALKFDATIKIEHILKHQTTIEYLAGFGMTSVISAIECVDDKVLSYLDKGHTASDVEAAIQFLKSLGVELYPSFVPFTPWSTPESVADIIRFSLNNKIIHNIDPIHLTIRLLVPQGSLILARFPDHFIDTGEVLKVWSNLKTDSLQKALTEKLDEMTTLNFSKHEILVEMIEVINTYVDDCCKINIEDVKELLQNSSSISKTESWFCCAEPSTLQIKRTEGLKY